MRKLGTLTGGGTAASEVIAGSAPSCSCCTADAPASGWGGAPTAADCCRLLLLLLLLPWLLWLGRGLMLRRGRWPCDGVLAGSIGFHVCCLFLLIYSQGHLQQKSQLQQCFSIAATGCCP
jgi:hypothetical protein